MKRISTFLLAIFGAVFAGYQLAALVPAPLEDSARPHQRLQSKMGKAQPLASEALVADLQNAPEQALAPKAFISRRGETGSAIRREDRGRSLAEALSEARHAVRELSPAESAPERNSGVALFACQPRNDFTVRFLDDGGVTLRSGRAGEDWQGTLRLSGSAEVRPVKTGNARVEISHSADLVEWYVNRPESLEHGFSVNSPRADMDPAAGLQLEVAVDGLQVQSDQERPGDLIFLGAEGERLLGYRKLVVIDSLGKEIPSEMRPGGAGILIAVDDSNACYPLQVDPDIVSLQQELHPSTPPLTDPLGRTGHSVDISASTVVVGAKDFDTPAGADAGRVYVFRDGDHGWRLEGILEANDAAAGDGFGTSVSMVAHTIVVGAPEKDDATGCAYVYVRTGSTWSFEQKIVANWGEGEAGDRFGSSVASYIDRIVVGAPGADSFTVDDTGAAYVFSRELSFWGQNQELMPNIFQPMGGFGSAVATSAENIVVGAPDEGIGGLHSSGSAYVYGFVGVDWLPEQKLGEGAPSERFGASVAASGNTVVVGTPDDFTLAGDKAGSVYVYTGSSSVWTQQQRLQAGDASGGDHFGFSVAVDGDRLVVGASLDDSPGTDSGSAYAFGRTGSVWTQKAKLVDGNSDQGEHFGFSVAVSLNFAVVGAPQDTLDQGTHPVGKQGSAYVFEESGSTWRPDRKLDLYNTFSDDLFGVAVAYANNLAAVGAELDDTPMVVNGGVVYVFQRIGETWALQQRVVSDEADDGDRFGSSVAIDINRTLLVGARADEFGSQVGMAYVFTRPFFTWIQQRRLSVLGSSGIGEAVALSGDTAVLGAPSTDTAAGGEAGKAYVFTRAGTNWSLQETLEASDGAAGDLFGSSVSVDEDTAVVGAPSDDSGAIADAGGAYVFTREADSWSQEQKLAHASPGEADAFGFSVGIHGESVLIGVPGDDTPSGVEAGSAHVFTRSGSTWALQATLAADDASGGDHFGNAVAIDADTALVGAVDAGAGAGAAYVYARQGSSWTQLQKLIGDSPETGDAFGKSLDIHGITVIVGAFQDNNALGDDVGAAHVFEIAGIVISQNMFAENQPVGTTVCSISVGGSTDGWTFSLVEGPASNNNDDFEIVGNDLVTTTTFDYETQEFRLFRVRATSAIRTLEQWFGIGILDDRSEDTDGDGLSQADEEDLYHTSDSEIDSDGDGIHDGTEVTAGLDPSDSNADLIDVLRNNLAEFGIDEQNLSLGQALLLQDPATGKLVVPLKIKRSSNLSEFFELNLLPGDVAVNPAGEIGVKIPSPGPREFFRGEVE